MNFELHVVLCANEKQKSFDKGDYKRKRTKWEIQFWVICFQGISTSMDDLMKTFQVCVNRICIIYKFVGRFGLTDFCKDFLIIFFFQKCISVIFNIKIFFYTFMIFEPSLGVHYLRIARTLESQGGAGKNCNYQVVLLSLKPPISGSEAFLPDIIYNHTQDDKIWEIVYFCFVILLTVELYLKLIG